MHTCSYRKYLYPHPHRRDIFSLTPTPPPNSSYISFNFFGLEDLPPPPGITLLFGGGGGMEIFWRVTAQCKKMQTTVVWIGPISYLDSLAFLVSCRGPERFWDNVIQTNFHLSYYGSYMNPQILSSV